MKIFNSKNHTQVVLYSLKVVTYHHNNEDIPACAGGPNYELLVNEIWPWVDIMLYSCLPFLIICVLNVHIIRQVGQTFYLVISCALKEAKCTKSLPCPSHGTFGNNTLLIQGRIQVFRRGGAPTL